MILATDLDRTLLPNGPDEFSGELDTFFEKIAEAGISLWYVTGRNIEQFQEAKKKFGVCDPQYLIAHVGTRIYEHDGKHLIEMDSWSDHVHELNPHWQREQIISLMPFADYADAGLREQEDENQNAFKVSLYLDDHDKKDEVVRTIRTRLANDGIEPDIIWSFDPLKDDVGLIDILPKGATKLGALQFLEEHTGRVKQDIIYAGDSGNDLAPLTAGYRVIVVNNAPDDVKQEVRNTASNKAYIAKGGEYGDGNYANGVLEGLQHFGVV